MRGLIGVLGDMGPAATVNLFSKFVTFTAAQRDQEYVPLIISFIPDIPDRTDALMHHGHSPLPAVRNYMHKLKDAGAECIVIPYNAAHFQFDESKEYRCTELLSIVEATMDKVKNYGEPRIGLLTTNATLYMGLYRKGIESLGLTYISSDSSDQEEVMESIYCLKASDPKRAQTLMNEQAEVLFSRDTQIIVLGCTKVPVILANAVRKSPDRYIDSTGSLVRAGIEWYKKRAGKHHLLAQQRSLPD